MRKAVDGLMKVLSKVLGGLLFAAVVIIVLQIVSRYVLKAPLGWTDQLCRFMYIWIIMLGLPILFHTKSVTAFDSLSEKLSKRNQTILHIVICLLTIFFAVCFCIFGWQFMMKKGGQMIPAFRVVPYYALYIAMPISAVLLFIEMVLQLVESIKELKEGDK